MSLSIVTFWLTAFPLQGFLLPQKEYCLGFLLFHSLSYGIIFLKFNWFEKFNFFPLSIITIAFLTAFFPFTPEFLKVYILVIIAIFSPLILLRVFLLIKQTSSSYFPYLGFILGNGLTFTLQLLPLDKAFLYIFLGTSLIPLYFLKSKVFSVQETQTENLDLSSKTLAYLFLAIFTFYLSRTLVYQWIAKEAFQIFLNFILLTLFYSLGILLGIFLKIKKIFSWKNLFILNLILLTFSKVFLHFKEGEIPFLTYFSISAASGMMDFLTLYFFINAFSNIKFLPLLYSLINFSLFLGNLLFYYLIPYREKYILSFLTLVILLTFVFLYKVEIKEKPLEEKTSEEEVTPELLRTQINESLNPLRKQLTLRESEVLFYHIIEGKNLQEVAQILGISRSSVREYLRRASIKLGCSVYELPNKIK